MQSKAKELTQVALRNGSADCLESLFIEAMQFASKSTQTAIKGKRKRCNECNVKKFAADFHIRADSKDGLRATCKACLKLGQQTRDTSFTGISRGAYEKEHADANKQAEMTKRNYEIQLLKRRVFIAAREAEYASKGIWLGGLLIDIPIKVCTGCESQSPATTDYFWADNRRKDGLNCRCKNCLKKV